MRKYKLKELRDLVRLGVAEDYTNKPSEYIYTLRRLEKVGYWYQWRIGRRYRNRAVIRHYRALRKPVYLVLRRKPNMNLDTIMAELAQYIRMQEEAAAMVESLKDQLKERMTAAGVESLAGSEHKATYKAVTSSRVDTTRLKKDLPEIAARYTKTTTARRFTFA